LFVEEAQLFAQVSRRGAVEEEDGIVLIATGLSGATLNHALATRMPHDPGRALERARAFYERRGVDWRLWAWEGVATALMPAAAASGFTSRPPEPGMLIAPIPTRLHKDPSALTIRRVSDADDLGAYQFVLAESFGLPLEGVADVFRPVLLDDPRVTLYLGTAEGTPAATAMRFEGQDILGINTIGTLPAFRRHGIAEAMTWHAAREGPKAPAAFLTSSPMGFPLYLRMGFRHVVDYHRWKP
jgi:GNAT superfamily N-acetyltransferase